MLDREPHRCEHLLNVEEHAPVLAYQAFDVVAQFLRRPLLDVTELFVEVPASSSLECAV
jgi:hypothetical protein